MKRVHQVEGVLTLENQGRHDMRHDTCKDLKGHIQGFERAHSQSLAGLGLAHFAKTKSPVAERPVKGEKKAHSSIGTNGQILHEYSSSHTALNDLIWVKILYQIEASYNIKYGRMPPQGQRRCPNRNYHIKCDDMTPKTQMDILCV